MNVINHRPSILFLAFIITLSAGCNKKNEGPADTGWADLLDMSLSQWDKFIGVPHYNITTLPDHPKGDGVNGIPLGLNNDPLFVFKTEEENGRPVLHISGEIYGGLSTKREYGDYHFKAEFRWGERKYEPRLTQKRDNGILYHAYGPQGKFWNVWMNSQEMQVQEGDMGDYYALGPAMDIRAADTLKDNEQGWIYDPGKPMWAFGDGGVSGRCRRSENHENPYGMWNTLELICLKGKSIHIINGHVVMIAEHSRVRQANGSFALLERGKIQIQSEGAEAYYRNIRIRAITEIPEAYR